MLNFIKSRILSGMLFLVPIVLLLIILKQGHDYIGKLVAPLLARLPIEIERVIGIIVVDLLALGVLLLICFLAGLVARRKDASGLITWLEINFLQNIPGYEIAKAKLTAKLRFEAGEYTTVLVRFDDQWQIGFEMDRISGEMVVVYLPGSPDPWSGAVTIVTHDRIKRLGSNQVATLSVFKHLGRGTSADLKAIIDKA